MADEDFEARVLALLAEAVPRQFKKTPMVAQTRLRQDLGMDSIALLALLFRFEQTFEVDLAAIDIGATLGQLRTIGDILSVGRDVLARARAGSGG